MELITQKNTKNDGVAFFCIQQSGNRKEHSLKVSTVLQRRQHLKCISRMCQQKTFRYELREYHDL